MTESPQSKAPVPVWMLVLFAAVLALNLTAAVIPMWTRIVLGLFGLGLVIEGLRRRTA